MSGDVRGASTSDCTPDCQTTSRHHTTTTETRNSRRLPVPYLPGRMTYRRWDRKQAREDASVNPSDSSRIRVQTSALAKALSQMLVAIR
jgi:hypothetical protein